MAAFAIILSAISSSAVFLFGFWVGRCARKLPVIDDNLPWTMHREQAQRCPGDCMPSSDRDRRQSRQAGYVAST
jgi:hypothetical protein